MKKKTAFLTIIACLLIALFALSSCGEKKDNPNTENGYSFTDSTGKTVTLAAKPTKTAVLFSSLADIWKTAGGEIAVTVGESVERGLCDDSVILVDKGAGKTIDIEAIAASGADFVIGSADIEAQSDAAAQLSAMGIPTACFRVDSFSDYLSVLKIFTDILGTEENYQRYGENVEKEIKALLSAQVQSEQTPSVLFIRSGSSSRSAKAKKADDHFAAKMLEELGCQNIADSAPVLLDGLSLEEIMSADPEYIFISIMGDEEAGRSYITSLLRQEGWKELSAVKEGRVYILPKDLFQFKPCARWSEAYRYLADILGGEIKGDNLEQS